MKKQKLSSKTEGAPPRQNDVRSEVWNLRVRLRASVCEGGLYVSAQRKLRL